MASTPGTAPGHLTAPASGSVEIEGAVEALQQRGVRRVAITWVNHAGAPLVKVVPLTRFAQAVQEGVGFSPVADAFGASGGIDPAHGLARPDGDLRLRAVAQALAPLDPEGGWAWASGERFETGGSPYPGDQRATCRRLQQQLQQQGVELRAGFELEWLVAVPDDQGRPQPIIPGGPYGADRLVEGLDYAAALLDALDGAGIPWLQFHPEYGPSQFELSLDAASPLEAADRLVHARLVVQRVTRRFGWRCSFSPKPCLERVGNGGHLHLSLRQQGVPLLEGGDAAGGLRPAGGSVLASLLEELPALLALSCPLAISYRRLAPGSWSAPFQAWGIENRETALRLIPASAAGVAAHLELKVADLAANPYLLLAAVLALVQRGLDRAIPLPAPVRGDPALLPVGSVPRLPSDLAQAAAAFAASSVLRSALGEALHASLCDSQAAEQRRAAALDDGALVACDGWWPLVGGLV